jgi:hypothetical protein
MSLPRDPDGNLLRNADGYSNISELLSDDGPALEALFDEIPNPGEIFHSEGPADAVSTFIALPEGHD